MGATFKKKSVSNEHWTYLVRISGREEWHFIYDYLTQRGFDGTKYNMIRDYLSSPTNSIFINTKEKWFGFVSVWGGATFCQKGVIPISVDEFLCFIWSWAWDIDIGEDYCDIYAYNDDIVTNKNEWIKYHLDKKNFESIKFPLKCYNHTRTIFIKSLYDKFYKVTHVDDWFEYTEFEDFCNQFKIEYTKERIRMLNQFEYEIVND